jgi:hypothetical protein
MNTTKVSTATKRSASPAKDEPRLQRRFSAIGNGAPGFNLSLLVSAEVVSAEVVSAEVVSAEVVSAEVVSAETRTGIKRPASRCKDEPHPKRRRVSAELSAAEEFAAKLAGSVAKMRASYALIDAIRPKVQISYRSDGFSSEKEKHFEHLTAHHRRKTVCARNGAGFNAW